MAQNSFLSSLSAAVRYAVANFLSSDCVKNTVAKNASKINFDFGCYMEVSKDCAIHAQVRDLDKICEGILDLDVFVYDNFFELMFKKCIVDGKPDNKLFNEYVHIFLSQLRKIYMFVLNENNFGVNDIRMVCRLGLTGRLVDTEYIFCDNGTTFFPEPCMDCTLERAIRYLLYVPNNALDILEDKLDGGSFL